MSFLTIKDISNLCDSPHLCLLSFRYNLSYITLLIVLFSGDIELNPGPENEVKCICECSDESGLILQCDSCSCWSHSECVGVSSLPNWNFLTKLSFLSLRSFLQFNKAWQRCHPKSTQFLDLICQLIMFLINNPLHLQLKCQVLQQSHVHLPVLLLLFLFRLRTMSHILTNQL